MLAEIGRDFASKMQEFFDKIKVAERTRNHVLASRCTDAEWTSPDPKTLCGAPQEVPVVMPFRMLSKRP